MSEEYLKRQYEIIKIIFTETNAYLTEAASYIEITLKHITGSKEEYSHLIRNNILDSELENDIHYNIRLKANDRKHESEESIYFNNTFSIEQALSILEILDRYLTYLDENYDINFKYEKFMDIYKKELKLREKNKTKVIVKEKIVEKEIPVIKEKIVEKEVPVVKTKVVTKKVPVIQEKVVKKNDRKSKIIIVFLLLFIVFLIYICFNLGNVIDELRNLNIIKEPEVTEESRDSNNDESTESSNNSSSNSSSNNNNNNNSNNSSSNNNNNNNSNSSNTNNNCTTCIIEKYVTLSTEKTVYTDQYDIYYSDVFGYVSGIGCSGVHSIEQCITQSYSSSNSNVADIDEKTGIIKVKKAGNTNLKLCYKNEYTNKSVCYSGKLNVLSSDEKCEVKFNSNSTPLKKASIAIYENSYFHNKFNISGSSTSCSTYTTYKSSDNSIVSIDSSGKIDAKNIGNVTLSICAVSSETNKELDCYSGELSVTHHDNNGTYSCYNAPNNTVHVGEKISDSEYGFIGYHRFTNCYLKYESSDSNIATVDSNGNVTGISPGIVKIKVTWIESPTYVLGTCEWSVNVK